MAFPKASYRIHTGTYVNTVQRSGSCERSTCFLDVVSIDEQRVYEQRVDVVALVADVTVKAIWPATRTWS